jgi:hypothetical protein
MKGAGERTPKGKVIRKVVAPKSGRSGPSSKISVVSETSLRVSQADLLTEAGFGSNGMIRIA